MDVGGEAGGVFDVAVWQRRIRVAQGQEPADLVLAGGHVVDVFGGELFSADVAIADGRIAGVGDYPEAVERIDTSGKIVAPSFIDAHVHLESALVWVTEFARAVVPRGTGAVVTDPHELANVCGLAGVARTSASNVGSVSAIATPTSPYRVFTFGCRANGPSHSPTSCSQRA